MKDLDEDLEGVGYSGTQAIAHKFSPAMVFRVTGYDGLELYEFMEFCNFKRKFLLDANDYRIVEAILKKQKIFSKLKED